ncbi:MAG: class I SAM-dependent methyltransferase [Candidatus Hodarchaeota archaeon]
MDYKIDNILNIDESTKISFNLHFLEEKLMVSPLKKLMFSYFELRIFKHLLNTSNIKIKGKKVLEVGCGAGYGIEQIFRNFKPIHYYAFDSSQKMVLLSFAKIKNKKLPVNLFLGDVREIKHFSNKFDVVFVFTVLHHVVGWQEALKEINRVLRPKGLLLINEINNRSLNWFERYLKVYHPRKARFTWDMFRHGLSEANFFIIKEFFFLKDLGFFLCLKK